MRNRNETKQLYFDYRIVIILFWFLVILAKIVRYTILKHSLVDYGIGHGWLFSLINGDYQFHFLETGEESIVGADAGGNSVAVFGFLFRPLIENLGLTSYISFEIVITVLWNVIIFLILLSIKRYLSFYQIVFIFATIVCMNIFDLTLAKEPIQFLFFGLLFLIHKASLSNFKKIFLSILVILTSVFTFRVYYILFIFFFIIISIITFLSKKMKYKTVYLLFVYFVSILSFFLLMALLQRFLPSIYSTLYRVGQNRGLAANTVIKRFFSDSGNLVLYIVDYALIVVRLLFPIEIISLGLQYQIYFIIQAFVSIVLIFSFFKTKIGFNNKMLVYMLILAFLFASATFEPDFGSWIRHEMVLSPLMRLAIDVIRVNRKADTTILFMRRHYC